MLFATLVVQATQGGKGFFGCMDGKIYCRGKLLVRYLIRASSTILIIMMQSWADFRLGIISHRRDLQAAEAKLELQRGPEPEGSGTCARWHGQRS